MGFGLPMNWYLAIRRMTEPPASWRDLLPAHLAWLKDRHDTGTIIMSGPGAEPRLGIYIMRAPGAGRRASRKPRASFTPTRSCKVQAPPLK